MQPPFSMSGFIDGLRRLIISHGTHDEKAFRQSAESLVRELGVTNRPDEAKALRDAISLLTLNGSQISENSSKLPSVSNRNGDPVLSILKPKIKKEAVFLSNDAQKSLKLIIEENQN